MFCTKPLSGRDDAVYICFVLAVLGQTFCFAFQYSVDASFLKGNGGKAVGTKSSFPVFVGIRGFLIS